MEGNMVADISTIPVLNLLVVCLTILALAAIAVFFFKKMGYIQFGAFTVRKDQEGQSTMHSMDEENADTDDLLKSRLRQMTNSLRKRIVNMFNVYPACAMTRRTLASSLRFPLYESIGNNHYTKELMPDRFHEYRNRMLTSLEDEYTDLVFSAAGDLDCAANELPPWKDASPRVEQFLDKWLLDVVNLVKDCSKQKIDTYEKYAAFYRTNKDTFRTRITDECIQKNKRYIAELEQRSLQLQKDVRQREEQV